MQGHEALQVRGVAIGASTEDDVDQLRAAGAGGVVDRPVPIVALEIHVGVSTLEELWGVGECVGWWVW